MQQWLDGPPLAFGAGLAASKCCCTCVSTCLQWLCLVQHLGVPHPKAAIKVAHCWVQHTMLNAGAEACVVAVSDTHCLASVAECRRSSCSTAARWRLMQCTRCQNVRTDCCAMRRPSVKRPNPLAAHMADTAQGCPAVGLATHRLYTLILIVSMRITSHTLASTPAASNHGPAITCHDNTTPGTAQGTRLCPPCVPVAGTMSAPC